MVLFLAAPPAHANMGIPMLAVVWPVMWILLVPIILMEAAVGTKLLHLEFIHALRIAAIANLISTLIGVPVTWLLLMIFELRVGKGGGVYGLDTLQGRLLSVTLQSPWVLPYEEKWVIPAASLFLCIPFCMMSVWAEFNSAQWYTHNRLPKQELLIWSWTANGMSYGMLAIIIAIILVRSLLKDAPEKSSDSILSSRIFQVIALPATAIALFGAVLASFVVKRILGGPKQSAETDRKKQLERKEPAAICDFCGIKSSLETKLVAGPGAYICHCCTDACITQLAANGEHPATSDSFECNFCSKSISSNNVAFFLDNYICRDCLELVHQMHNEEWTGSHIKDIL